MPKRLSTTSWFLIIAGIGIAACSLAAAPAFAGAPAERAYQQARQFLQNGNYDAAISQLDAAIRLETNQAKFFGLRATAWLAKSEYAKGTADLKDAIRLNPGDAGKQYRTTTANKLSAEALEHGRKQVERMLRDRPAMAQFPNETDFLRNWAIKKFAGESFGSPIDWDPSAPLHSDAEHLSPTHDERAAILVAANYDRGPNAKKPRSFEELWAGAVYELHNVNYAREFIRLNDEANQGKLSKKAFVAGILKYELRAAQETRAFYLQALLPWIEKKGLKTDATLWFCDWWDSPDTALHGFTNKLAYPWRPYARTHDWATVDRHWRLGKIAKALGLLRQMRAEEGYDEEQADLDYWINRCKERIRNAAPLPEIDKH